MITIGVSEAATSDWMICSVLSDASKPEIWIDISIRR